MRVAYRWMIVAFVLLASCSRAARVRATFHLPPGVVAGPSVFHASVAANCWLDGDAGTVATPEAGAPSYSLDPDDGPDATPGTLVPRARAAGVDEVAFDDGSFVVNATFYGRACKVTMTGWVDVNGNGKVDTGDATGSFPEPILIADHGFCMGNLTKAPPVVMTTVR